MKAHSLRLVHPTPVVCDLEDIRADTRELADLMQRLAEKHPDVVRHMLRFAKSVVNEPSLPTVQ